MSAMCNASALANFVAASCALANLRQGTRAFAQITKTTTITG